MALTVRDVRFKVLFIPVVDCVLVAFEVACFCLHSLLLRTFSAGIFYTYGLLTVHYL